LMPEVRECQDVFVINNAFHEWGHCFLYDQRRYTMRCIRRDSTISNSTNRETVRIHCSKT
jgi:hypothetical protein